MKHAVKQLTPSMYTTFSNNKDDENNNLNRNND